MENKSSAVSEMGDRLATIYVGRKVREAVVPPFLGGAGSPSNTMSPGPSLPVCPVCDVGVLWPNGWMDQDTTWCGGRPRPKRHCFVWGPQGSMCYMAWTLAIPGEYD